MENELWLDHIGEDGKQLVDEKGNLKRERLLTQEQ